MMDIVQVELLVIADCPHEAAAVEVLRSALDDLGLATVDFGVTLIDSTAAAEQRRFVGSPTFTVDGDDVFPEVDQHFAVSCRLYADGRGVPELRDLRQALKGAFEPAVQP
jgi:hypothetical protein